MITSLMAEQFANAEEPMEVTELGISKELVIFLQLKNAYPPIVVTELPNVIVVRSVHLPKA